MEVYNTIMASLDELLANSKGEKDTLTRHTLIVDELQDFTPQEIRSIRISAKMTQSLFAMVIGVSIKTVEAWEGGRNKPDGAARRLIGLLKKNSKFADEAGIVTR